MFAIAIRTYFKVSLEYRDVDFSAPPKKLIAPTPISASTSASAASSVSATVSALFSAAPVNAVSALSAAEKTGSGRALLLADVSDNPGARQIPA